VYETWSGLWWLLWDDGTRTIAKTVTD
jgi:hypothetical protein